MAVYINCAIIYINKFNLENVLFYKIVLIQIFLSLHKISVNAYIQPWHIPICISGPDGKPAVIYDKITPEKRHEPVDHVARPETTTITEKPKTSSNRCAAKKNLLDSMLDSLPDLPPVSVYNFPDDEESEPSTTTAPQAKKPHKVKGQWGSSHIFGRRYRGRGRGGRGRGSHSKSTLHGVRRSWPARTKDSWRGKVFSAREAIFEPPPRVEIDLAEDASLPATRLSPGNMSLSPHSKVMLILGFKSTCIKVHNSGFSDIYY